MNRSIGFLAGLVLAACSGAALAWGGHGGFHASGGAHPAFVAHPHFVHRRTVFVGGTFIVAAPYPYYYYPPAYYGYASPAYADPPTYVEQGDSIRYYCPDYRDYYPNVPECPSPWLQVVPGAGGYTR